MGPSSNSDLSFQYDTPMTPNDGRQENPSPHLTQNYDNPQPPPGAEAAGPNTFIPPWQADFSLQDSLPQGHINLEEDTTSRMLTQFSVGFLGDEPEKSLYPRSPPVSVSPSPSHTSQVHASLPGTLLFSSRVTALRHDHRSL
jgi:hypothetical protein